MATTNAQTFTIGGVTHQVEDTTARAGVASLQTALASLQSALDTLMGTDDITDEIDTYNEIKEFLDGFDVNDPNLSEQLTTLFTNVNDLVAAMPNKASVTQVNNLQAAVTNLQTALAGKVDAVNGKGLSTNDYTDAEKTKLAGIAAGAQKNVINGIKAHGASTNLPVTNGVVELPEQTEVDPDDYYDKDEVDALIGNIPAGPQGPKGDTVVVDTEGLEQFDLANSLDSTSTTDGLTARQGKILKQAIMTVAANLQAVYNALAGVAFISLPKPAQTPIDWTGGTFYASVVYGTMTGCNHTDNTNNGQIAEGSTLNVTLSAQSGFTLTGATISVTNGNSQSVAYTLNNNVLSVANVVGTINISVIAVGVFSVSNTDTNVDLSAQTLQPLSGSSWSGTLSIKSSVTGYHLAPTPNVTMGGVAVDFTASGNSWNSSTGAMTIGVVTGDIVIVSASEEVVTYNVRHHLLNMTNDGASTVEAGGGYTENIETTHTYNNDLRVLVGGVKLTAGTDYTYSNGQLSIPAAKITGDIDIIATAATGTITVKCNESTTVNLGGGVSAACTTQEGDLYVGTASATALTSLSLWGNTKVVEIDFGGAKVTAADNMFRACTALTTISNIVFTGGTTLNSAFYGDTSLTSLDMSVSDVDSVVNFRQMLYGCSSLERFAGATRTLGTSEVNITAMFNLCTALLDVEMPTMWMIATSLNNTFSGCSILSDIDISGITGVLTDIGQMLNRGGNNNSDGSMTLHIGAISLSDSPTTSANLLTNVGTLFCFTDDVPDKEANTKWLTYMTKLTAIYVPNNAVEAYKTAWSSKVSIIHPISEYTE